MDVQLAGLCALTFVIQLIAAAPAGHEMFETFAAEARLAP